MSWLNVTVYVEGGWSRALAAGSVETTVKAYLVAVLPATFRVYSPAVPPRP